MRAPLIASLLLTAALTGCLGGAPGEDVDTQRAADLAPPPMPDGLSIQDGERLSRTETTATWRWADTAPVLTDRASAAVTTVQPRDPVTTVLELPALVPLNLTLHLADNPGPDVDIEVTDEYGRERCDGRTTEDGGEICSVPWVRPTGATRAWTVHAMAHLPSTSGATEAPFEVTIEVATLPYDGPLDPRDLEGLGDLLPFEATADDGVALRGHVYLPEGDGPFATVLEYSPYWNSANSHSEQMTTETPDGRTVLEDRLGKFLEAGYAVALVNIRGTGESEGCNTFLGPQDGPDARAVIETLAAQPWSNGAVGMGGISWFGYSQYAALRESPEALKAVVPSSAVLDPWNLWTRTGPGLITQFGPLASSYAVFLSLTSVGIRGDTPVSHLPCPEYATYAEAYNQLTLTGDKAEFWSQRDMHDVIANTEIPMFVTNGLTQGEGHILQVEGLWELMPQGERRLLLGQWGHQFPADEKSERWDQEVLDWFDHHLRGAPAKLATDVVEYQDDRGTWHTSPTWPPASDEVVLHLSDGELVTDPAKVTSSSTTFTTPNLAKNYEAYPAPCADRAVYVSPPLAEDVLLAGNFHTNLTVEASAPNGNFVVWLWHGEALLTCDDVADAPLTGESDAFEVRRAVSDLAHRGYLEQGEPFPTSGSDVMAMKSYPLASHIPAGHRLMLVVAGHSSEIEPKPMQPAITVLTGDGADAWISLPLLEGKLAFEPQAGSGASDPANEPGPRAGLVR
ncbi:MAG: CocE/NonD family hydrolase [Candidatus Thermoplasmatota archaeon]|nr:CocE/NonD family hydrolase [Candidatus Thermoplasmatota archaeon]